MFIDFSLFFFLLLKFKIRINEYNYMNLYDLT